MTDLPRVTSKIQSRFAADVLSTHQFLGDETIVVKRDIIRDLYTFLRDDPELQFNILMDLTAVDYAQKHIPRFEVVYHFLSLPLKHRLRVKVPVDEKECSVPSLALLNPGANWYEREVWDMYGIRFEGHPNLKRILMYEEFQGHPLRKDYPVNKRQPLMGPVN